MRYAKRLIWVVAAVIACLAAFLLGIWSGNELGPEMRVSTAIPTSAVGSNGSSATLPRVSALATYRRTPSGPLCVLIGQSAWASWSGRVLEVQVGQPEPPTMLVAGTITNACLGESVEPALHSNTAECELVAIGAPGRSAGFPLFASPGEPRESIGSVLLCDPRTGRISRELRTGSLGDGFGFSLLTAAQQQGPTPDTLLIGAPGQKHGVPGRVYVYALSSGEVRQVLNGRTSSILLELWSFVKTLEMESRGGDLFGYSMAQVADCDGDGVADFAVGAPWRVSMFTQRGAVDIYSGATWAKLKTFTGEAGSLCGVALAPVPASKNCPAPQLAIGCYGGSSVPIVRLDSLELTDQILGDEFSGFGGSLSSSRQWLAGPGPVVIAACREYSNDLDSYRIQAWPSGSQSPVSPALAENAQALVRVVPDCDGDQQEDLLVASIYGGDVRLISSRTGLVLWSTLIEL